MYKIMLVDDEAEVREAIEESIDWKHHGYEFVGSYSNGLEALNSIPIVCPDLILSDICMPFMDGIEMTKRIRQSAPSIKIIILTGHDDFDYAQQSLRLKVHDFIVKPITPRELRALLDQVKLDLDREAETRENAARLQFQLQESLPLLKEKFLETMINSEMSDDELEAKFAYFNLPTLAPPFLAVSVDIDNLDDSSKERWEQHPELLQYAAYKIVTELAENKDVLVFRARHTRIVAIFSGGATEALFEEAGRISETIRQYAEKVLKFTVTVGIGVPCASLNEISRSYQSSVAALDYRFVLGNNRVIPMQEMQRPTSLSYSPDHEWNRKFACALKMGTDKETFLLIEQYIGKLKSSGMPIEVCYVQIQSMMIEVVNSIRELVGNEGDWILQLGSALQHINDFHRLEDIEAWLKKISNEAILLISEQRSDLSQIQVRRAVEYIEQNYRDESLSLMDICNHAHMSKSYLSVLFKQQTGQTMMEYVTRIRLETAKTLLHVHPPIKTIDIAANVGYGDPQYFSVLFKKHTGTTPTEFRDIAPKESYG